MKIEHLPSSPCFFEEEGEINDRCSVLPTLNPQHPHVVLHAVNRDQTKSGRRYFAVARAVNDGHAFVFDYMEPRAPKGGDMKGEG